MGPTPSQDRPKPEGGPSLADLSRERLPRLADSAHTGSAGYNASSPGGVRRYQRNPSAREKRLKSTSAQKAERLFRDGILARLWHAAAVGDPRVAPRVQEHFARCVEACLANEAVAVYLAQGLTGWSEASLKASPIVRVEF